MLTTKTSLPFVPGTGNSRFIDGHVELGEMPSSSARARMNGLKLEPGWRWPWVARLKGVVL